MKYNKLKTELYYFPLIKAFPSIVFLRLHYLISCKKLLNLSHPKGFNAKLQWLKLYYHDDIFTRMVDKYDVKILVEEKIGPEYLIPTLGVWNTFEEIDFDNLPNQFVLKCTHDSGGLIICKDKESLDFKLVKKKLNKSLKRNYYYLGREWPYKNVRPRIIAEKFMENPNKEVLDVYKIFTFSGVPKVIQTIQNDKTSYETIDYFDTDWKRLDMHQNYANSKQPLARPKTLSKMLELAKELSDNLPFVRVDFYDINGRVYFSEYTFYSDCGFARFNPESWDDILGDWLVLPKIKCKDKNI